MGAADGLSPVVRGGRAGCQRAVVAPKVASSPRGSGRRPPCGQPGSIPAAGVVVKKMKFFYMNKRGIQHASSDVGMIFTAYNLRRILNILDKNLLKAYLKGLGHYFWPFQRPFKAIFRHSGFLGWESEFFVRLFFGMLKC
jgi:hypothetical protein